MSGKELKFNRKDNYNLIILSISHTMTHVLQRIHPLLFPILRQEFNLSLPQLGIIAAIPPIAQSLISIPAGYISDKVGPKILITLSLIVAFGGAVLVGQSVEIIILILGISMLSINGSIYHPPAYSLTADLFEGKKRSKAFGYFSMGEKVSVGIGIITFSIMYGFFHIGWRYVYLIWAIPILLSSLIIWKIKIPEKEVQNENQIQAHKNSTKKGEKIFKGFSMSFILLLVYISIVTLSGAVYSNFLSIYFIDEKGLDLAFVSLLFTIGSLSGIISSPLGGYFASKFGDKKWTIISRSINLSLLGLFAISPSNILAIFFFILFEFAESLPSAARATLIARLAPERRKGLGYSISFIPGWVMGSLGSVIGASVAVTFGLWSLFPLALCILSLGILILVFGIKSE